MRHVGKRLLVCVLAFVMLAAMAPSHVEAKTVAEHTVFSKKQVDKRLKTIRDYYYNKPKQLTVRKQKVRMDENAFTVSYYLHGKDLMFGYGVDGKTEYRMYFYKNQLIQMLVDAPGESRKTYTQSYRKLENTFYDEMLCKYMDMEGYGRKLMDSYSKKKRQIVTDYPVIITKISGNTITYHKIRGYGSDGSMTSMSKTAYKAKVSSNVKVEDATETPDEGTYRSFSWLKNQISSSDLGLIVWLEKSGSTVSKILLPYFA